MSSKRIGITLSADESGLRRGLNLASIHTGQFAKETEQAMDRASAATERTRTMIGNMARSAASILAIGKVIGLADDFGQLQSRLEGATKSHAEYVAVQERLVEAAGRTYRRVGDGVEVFARTAESLRQLGYTSGQAADLVATMTYGLTVSAADTEKTASAVNAFSNAILTGKMGVDQLNSLIAASPRLQQAMADALGTTNAGLTEMARNGGLSVQQLMQVVNQMEVLGSEADEMKTSVQDALGRSWDRLGLRINELNEATGATDGLVAAIDLVSENLGVLGTVGGGLAAGYLVKSLGSISKAGWDAASAMRAQAVEAAATRPAVQALATANLAAAQSEAVRARAAVAAATASFNAARGTAQETAAAQALLVARQAGAAADRNAAAAKAALAAASGGVAGAARGVLGFLGGPAGLIVTTGLAAAGFLAMSSSAYAATPEIDGLSLSIEKLNKQQLAYRQQQVGELIERLDKKAGGAQQALDGLEKDYAALGEALSRGGVSPEELENVNKAIVEARSVLADANGEAKDARALQERLATALREVEASANGLASGLQGVAVGMAAADWDKYLAGLTDARDVIGMTAQQLAEYQARAKGANDEQALLAGIVASQTDAYRSLEKAIQDKDGKARQGAVKVLDDLAKQEAATAALTLRTAALAKLQLEIARGASLAYAESAMAGIDAQAQGAYDAKIAEHRARLERIINTPPKSGGRTARQTETEGQKLLKSIEDRITALKVEALAYGDVSQAQKELIEFEQRLTREKDASLKASASTVRARLAVADAQERANKAVQQGRDMQKAYADGILDANADLYESYLRLQDQVDTWAASDREAALNMEALEQARIRERLATEDQVLWREMSNKGLTDEAKYSIGVVNGLTQQLEIRQQLAALGDTAYNRAESRRKIEAQAQDWGKVLDGLRENFQEGFFAALGDRDALSAFGDNLKRSAKTAFASAAYEAFAKPIFVRLVAEIAGLTGGGAVRDQVLRQAGIGGQANGSFDAVSSAGLWVDRAMFNGAGAMPGSVAYANWAAAAPGTAAYTAGGDGLSQLVRANPQWSMSGIGSWFGNAPASSMFSLGGVNSATGISTAAGGAMTAGAGLVGGYLGGAMFGNKGQSSLGGGLGASAGMMIGTSAAIGSTAIGAQLGMAAGPVGAAIGMAIGAALGSVIGAAEKRFGGGYTANADGNFFRSGGPSGGDPNEAQTAASVQGVRDSVRELAAKLGGDASALNFAAGWELSPDKGRSFVFSDWAKQGEDLSWQRGLRDMSGVKDGDVVAAEFQSELQRAVLRGLAMSGLATAFSEYLGRFDIDGLDAAGVAVVTANLDAMLQFRDALGQLPFSDLAGLSLEAGLKLAEFSGGMDALLGNMQSYYDLVYSEEERTAHMQERLAGAFADLGLALPGSAAELRSLVEGLDTTTDAGLKTRAQVYALSGAFGELQAILDQQAQAIAGERLGLEQQLLVAMDETAELRRLELEALDPSNRALQQRIWDIRDEKEAKEKAERLRDEAQLAAAEVRELESAFFDAVDPAGMLARQQQSLADQFAAVGQLMPSTLEDYANLVLMTKALGEAHADEYTELLRIAPAFAAYIDGLRGQSDAVLESARVFAAAQQTAKDSIADTIGGLRERIVLDQLGNDASRHSYYDAQFQTYAALSESLNDPAAIADAVAKASAAAGNAYGLLDEAGRAANNDKYLKTLAELQERSTAAVDKANERAGEKQGKALVAALKPVLNEVVNALRTTAANSYGGSRSVTRAIEAMEDTLAEAIERSGRRAMEVTG